MKTLLTQHGIHSPQPKDINTWKHFWEAFGDYDTETSAAWLIRLADHLDQGWKPFSAEQLQQFYDENVTLSPGGHKHPFVFGVLITNGWIIKDDEGDYHFTTQFVERCNEHAFKE